MYLWCVLLNHPLNRDQLNDIFELLLWLWLLFVDSCGCCCGWCCCCCLCCCCCCCCFWVTFKGLCLRKGCGSWVLRSTYKSIQRYKIIPTYYSHIFRFLAVFGLAVRKLCFRFKTLWNDKNIPRRCLKNAPRSSQPKKNVFWNLLLGNITKVTKRKENRDVVGASSASRYADLNHWRTAPSYSFQGLTTWCNNKISLKNQLHLKELKALKQVKEKIWWDLVGALRFYYLCSLTSWSEYPWITT